MKVLPKVTAWSKSVVKTTADFLSANSTQILTGGAVVGVFVTGVMAAKATPTFLKLKEDREIEIAAENENAFGIDDLDRKETIKIAAKVYWPTAASAVLTATMVICAQKINTSRLEDMSNKLSGMATIATISENKLQKYQEKMLEELGKEKKEEIDKKVSEDLMNDDIHKTDTVFNSDSKSLGKELFRDEVTGRIFWSTTEEVNAAVNRFNARLLDTSKAGFMCMEMSINDLYEELRLDAVNAAHVIGKCYDPNNPLESSLLEVEFHPIVISGVPGIKDGTLGWGMDYNYDVIDDFRGY